MCTDSNILKELIKLSEETIDEGLNLQKIRKLQGKTQEELSAETGIPQQTISDMEKQEKILDENNLEKIADALKVPVNAIKSMPKDLFSRFINYHYGEGNIINHEFSGTKNIIETQINLSGDIKDDALKAVNEVIISFKSKLFKLEEENTKLKAENSKLKKDI